MVFVAGGITGVPDWQREVAEALAGEHVVLLNPRRARFDVADPSAADEQIHWEFAHRRHPRLAAMLFWFPGCDPAVTVQPIALLELGEALARAELPVVVGADPGYPRVRDVEIQCGYARPELVVHATLAGAVAALRTVVRGSGTGFAGAEDQWRARLGKLRDVVRQELVARQLDAHLPPPPARVLDAGCGQGTQALRLARLGYQVTGLDTSTRLLDQLRDDLAAEEPAVRRRLRVVPGSIEAMAELFTPAGFDAVLCHGVLMYLPDPVPALRAIAAVTAPGGLVSLLVRNGDGLAMRPGLLGDWASAREAFDTTAYANRIGRTARADRLGELTATLADHALAVRRWYGVRVFTDTAPDDAAPPAGADLATLLACEERAGRSDPYRHLAALLHIVAGRAAAFG